MKEYCTQNNGDCSTCSLVNYGRDCQNNPLLVGKREGAGRKPSPPNLKKNMVSVKLPQWLIDWTAEQEESRAVLIEDALKNVHKLKEPDPADITFA